MGRVFSVEEIKNGQVPELSDFEDSLNGFLEVADTETMWGSIDGAFVFGSVVGGRHSRRSDLDCLIATPQAYTPATRLAFQRIEAASNPSGKIQVNAITHPRPRLAAGWHDIDKYFNEHLTGEGRLVRGNDPREYIRPSYKTPAQILYDYIDHKKRTVESVAFKKDYEKYKHLARVLELPLAIGRKALSVLDETKNISKAGSTTATKTEVGARALDLYASLSLHDVPQSILTLDQTYSKVLDAALAEKASDAEYLDVIGRIEQIAYDASSWLDELDEALQKQIARPRL